MPRESSRDQSCSLYIRNIHSSTRGSDLRKIFEKYGPVKDVYVPLDYHTREPRGFAYVQFEDSRDAGDAVKHEDGIEVNGRQLTVQFAQGDRKKIPVFKSSASGEMKRKTSETRRGDRRGSPRSRSRSRSHHRHRDDYRRPRQRKRSDSYSRRSRSRSPSKDRRRRSRSPNHHDHNHRSRD